MLPTARRISSFSLLRAQSSFEYLIILAVVLTLALATLGAFGIFPSFSYGAQGGDSQRYWANLASPIQVPDFKQTASTLTLILVNQAPVAITIPVGGFNLSTRADNIYAPTGGLPLTLPPGGRSSLTFITQSCTGRQVLIYVINASYATEQISGLMQRGAKPLYVQCMD